MTTAAGCPSNRLLIQGWEAANLDQAQSREPRNPDLPFAEYGYLLDATSYH
jgi:hypothetical protein